MLESRSLFHSRLARRMANGDRRNRALVKMHVRTVKTGACNASLNLDRGERVSDFR